MPDSSNLLEQLESSVQEMREYLPAPWETSLMRVKDWVGTDLPLLVEAGEVEVGRKDALLEQMAELITSRVFPLVVAPEPYRKLVADITYQFAKIRDLPEPAVRLLVDTWCQDILAKKTTARTKKQVEKFEEKHRLLFSVPAVLIRQQFCSLPMAGRLIRQMKAIPGLETPAENCLWALTLQTGTPSALSLRVLDEFQLAPLTPYAVTTAAYRQAKVDYPDLADLPAEMFIDTLASQPVPPEWFAEQHLDVVTVPGQWVAPNMYAN